jgi:hypothetical protein
MMSSILGNLSKHELGCSGTSTKRPIDHATPALCKNIEVVYSFNANQ